MDKKGHGHGLCVYKTEQGMTSNGKTWPHGTNLCLPFDVTVMLNLSIVVLFRYVEKNTRCHSLYRPYSNDVPVYLHDKPKPVIDTARHKISLAEEIPASDVKTTGTNGEFRVRSQDADKR